MTGGIRMATDLRAAARMSGKQFYPGIGGQEFGFSKRLVEADQDAP